MNELYDTEAKARNITGLAPRGAKSPGKIKEEGDGRGGPMGGVGTLTYSGIPLAMRPPNIIYGMAQPSADLILQEIRVRRGSLEQLVGDMQARKEQIARVPSVWPLAGSAGHINSGFGYRRDPFTRRVRHHDGTDIAAPYGTKVQATAAGVVVFAGYDGDYGRVVRIEHGNGTMTCYAHLARIAVQSGQRIERETLLGTVGTSGRTTGAHLHYEVHVKGKPVDPAKYLTE